MSKRRYVFAGTRRKLTSLERSYVAGVLLAAGLSDMESWDEWHHGDAPGVDTFVAELGEKWGYTVVPHPADWHTNGKKAGPMRNREMLDSGAFDKLWAFPSKVRSAGTTDCIWAALERKIDVEVVWLG